MGRISALIMVVFIIAFSLAAAQPKLEIEGGDIYNWGDVKSSESQVKAKIKLYNRGNEALKISKVQPTCGCTTAPLDKEIVQPNDFATLDVTLRIGSYAGPMQKTVKIESNDPANSSATLYLKCNVLVPISIVPAQYLKFGNMVKGKESVAKVTLKNTTIERITLKNITVMPENLKINLQNDDVIPPNTSIELTVKITPDVTGPFNCKINMQTTHPDMPTLSISGWGNVVSEEAPPR